MAKKLGKSVEALTAEEKSLAILNDTMRAGNLLIEQVGGNVDAATDSYARMEVAVTSLKDELSELASEGLEPTVTLMADVVSTARENVGAWKLIDRALRDNTITQQDYNEWLKDYLFYGGSQLELFAKIESRLGLVDGAVIELIGHERAYIEQIIELIGHERAYIDVVEDAAEAMWESTIASASMTREMYDAAEAGKAMAVGMRRTGRASADFSERMLELKRSSADALSELREFNREMKQQKIDDFFGVDMGIGDVAAQMFDIINFKEFGGEALEIMVKEVQAGLAEGKITPEQSREFFKNISIEAEAIKVKMGEIDASDAAESIAKDFNVPIAESRKLIDDVLEGIDLVNSADILAITEEFDALRKRKEELLEAGEFDLEADPGDEAQQTLDNLEDALFDLTTEPWQIDILINQIGKLPGGGGGGGGQYDPYGAYIAPGGQHGVDYVVPSGFPNDSYYQPVSSGEHVTVTPKGQGQGATTYTQNVTQHFYDEGAAALGLAVVRENGRGRLNASMGR
jgi:polyhydroxyalkanoate synthesis regulator phasin